MNKIKRFIKGMDNLFTNWVWARFHSNCYDDAEELLKDPEITEFFKNWGWVEHRTPEEIEMQVKEAEDRKRKELGVEAEES